MRPRRIIHGMRRGLALVLMVVLVLRGLVGTAMAAGVLPPVLPQAPAAVQHTHDQDHDHHQGHAHQPLHQQDAGPSAQHPAEPLAAAPGCADKGGAGGCSVHDHQSSTCSACEICHAAMLGTVAATVGAQSLPSCALPAARTRFDSALSAQAIKPPIG